ncbi:RNase adapter RapZ [Ectothiorhodospiraceae bacterium 2226]|nr:RNase adapter RapZ [Ectothiorhodospiraceae bacterium 2226]
MKLYIVSGLSGAGKSVALHVLEDLNVYCIDNLPVGLLPAFAQQITGGLLQAHQRAAVGIDARALPEDLRHFPAMLEQLEAQGLEIEIFFLEADEPTLLKRFSETRRKHPLTNERIPLAEAIRDERRVLEPISSRADLRLDTSRTTVHQLRDLIRERVTDEDGTMSLLFQSFGYKHGIPADVDFVFDVRCIPNPHWEPQLRSLTGLAPEVVEFLERDPRVTRMYEDLRGFLERWIPQFEDDNRSYMTVAVGCTGGQHRSVYLIERLARHFRTTRKRVLTRHRELS